MSAPKFKNELLNQATLRISEIYKDAAKFADEKNREIAKILGEVLDKKAYEKDGFSSVAEYANKTFGIARQNAYALANAGRVYNDKNSHPELKAMTPSKIAELSTVPEDKLKEALDSKKINHNSTQKELREFSSKTSPQKAEVVDTYTARICQLATTDELHDTLSSPKTLDDWDDWFQEYLISISPSSPVEVLKIPNGKVNSEAKKATVNRRLYLNKDCSFVVEYYKYSPKKEKANSQKPKYTKEELLAMIAQLDSETNKTKNETQN